LYLNNNTLSGSIPAGLLSHPLLISLVLNDNQLSGSLPTVLSLCTSLR
jgi:hypothetical protein